MNMEDFILPDDIQPASLITSEITAMFTTFNETFQATGDELRNSMASIVQKLQKFENQQLNKDIGINNRLEKLEAIMLANQPFSSAEKGNDLLMSEKNSVESDDINLHNVTYNFGNGERVKKQSNNFQGDRRSTMFRSLNEDDGLIDEVMQSNTVNKQPMSIRIYSDYIVADSDKLKYADVKAVYQMQKKYHQYLATAVDKSKGLAYWISDFMIHKIVDNERRLVTDLSLSLDYYKIYSFPDKVLMGAIARLIRPISERDYRIKIFKAISFFRPSQRGDENVVFAVRDYDLKFHAAMSLYCEEFVNYDTIFRYRASPEDSKLLPENNYGKDDHPGVCRLFMAGFGDFSDSYRNLVGENVLKNIQSLETLVEKIKDINDDYCSKAIALRKDEMKMQPATRLSQEIALLGGDKRDTAVPSNQRGNDKRVVVSEPKRDYSNRYPMTQQPKTPYPFRSNDVRKNSNSFRMMNEVVAAEEAYDAFIHQEMTHEYDDYEVEDVENVDEEYEDDVEKAAVHPSDVENDEDEIKALLAYGGANNYPQKPRDNDVKSDKQRACFTFFNTGVCKNGNACQYSHDKGICEKHYLESKQKLENSPFAAKNPVSAPGRYSLLQRQSDSLEAKSSSKSNNIIPNRG